MNFYELLTAPTHAFHSFLIFYHESLIIETHFTMSQNKDVPLREVLTLQLFFMRIDILTVLPEMIEGMINCSIV